MFGRKKEEEIVPKRSLFKSLKRLLLVVCLAFSGGLLVLSGFQLIQFNPDLIKYAGIGLLILAVVYNYLY